MPAASFHSSAGVSLMRMLILALAVSTLALAGCGKKQATGNTSSIDQSVTALDFDANDATAIDAATGADANMAADVDINLIDNADNGSVPGASSRSKPRTTADAKDRTEPANAAAPEPAPPPAEANTN